MIFKIPFLLFQDTERAVSNVTLASQNVIGYHNRHGYILAIQDSRSRYGKEVRLEDFQVLDEVGTTERNWRLKQEAPRSQVSKTGDWHLPSKPKKRNSRRPRRKAENRSRKRRE